MRPMLPSWPCLPNAGKTGFRCQSLGFGCQKGGWGERAVGGGADCRDRGDRAGTVCRDDAGGSWGGGYSGGSAGSGAASTDILARSRRAVAVDLKRPEGVAVLRDLARGADGLIEGFRPGVMERLGLGPDVLLADNPKLVFGRMTGWGQTGPLARTAGHDIDYIALAGCAARLWTRRGKAHATD